MRAVTFTGGNQVRLLQGGGEFFPLLEAACDAAVAEIYLETYIFAADLVGTRIEQALIRAARRGVQVHVIADWLGSGGARCRQLSRNFEQGGVRFRVFNPWFGAGVARMHRKICVIDREQAFLGGLNINDDCIDDSSGQPLPYPRWDFAISIHGPLVAAIQREAMVQWEALGSIDLLTRWENFRYSRGTRMIGGSQPAVAGLVVRDNLRNRYTIQRALMRALGRAHQSAWLANPYFAPGRKLRNALAAAAGRGVEVTLLLGVGQFRMQDAVARSFYPKLLKSGVRIIEYHKTQLHGKVAVIDETWATVGSSNYDGLSLFVNHEANVVLRDAEFAKSLRAYIRQGVAEGIAVRLADFANIPWYKRAWYGAAFLLYRGVMRVITLGRYN